MSATAAASDALVTNSKDALNEDEVEEGNAFVGVAVIVRADAVLADLGCKEMGRMDEAPSTCVFTDGALRRATGDAANVGGCDGNDTSGNGIASGGGTRERDMSVSVSKMSKNSKSWHSCSVLRHRR